MKSLRRVNQVKSGRLVPIFFVSLCVFSFAMVVVLNYKEAQGKAQSQEVTRFEIFGFEYYRIGAQGVSVVAVGKRARENSQKQSELEHFSIVNFTFPDEKTKEGVQENLQSSFAIYDNQEIYFPQGVHYRREATEFWSQVANYNPDKKELKGEGEFVILAEDYKIRGQNIIYKDSKVYADNIYGILKAK